MARKVAFIPGASFYPNGGGENTLRINFVSEPPERIREGLELLFGRPLPPAPSPKRGGGARYGAPGQMKSTGWQCLRHPSPLRGEAGERSNALQSGACPAIMV